MSTLLELSNISKTFPPSTIALNDVSCSVKRGEVHALLGENGAGKSTLMNVLYGLLTPDCGTIRINEEECQIKSPKAAIAHGIGMVHQHFMLVTPLTVVENIILAMDEGGALLDRKKVADKILQLSRNYHLQVDPFAVVSDLTVGQQQRVEIIKALYKQCDLLVLDEPTAVLTPQETEELFLVIEELRNANKSIIFITHKLDEVMRISDRITVLRNGKKVGTVFTKDTSPPALAEMMVGKKVLLQVEKEDKVPGDVVLEIKNLSMLGAKGHTVVNGLSLCVRSGEIYGIAGVDGNGQSELVKGITSLLPKKAGTITINGKDVTSFTARQILDEGVSHIPEDRHGFGAILDIPVKTNVVLQNYRKPPICKNGFVNWTKISEYTDKLLQEYDVRPQNGEVPFKSLSGGNQQKVVVARELERDPALLIAMHPTRGVDIGSIEFIHKQIVCARDRGKAVLLISTELEEIFSLSDRIGVIFEGKIAGEMDAADATINAVGLLMAGGGTTQS